MKLGYKKITIFEKENHVGGKCSSIPTFGKSVDAAASFINEGDQELMKLIKERKIPLLSSDSLHLVSKEGKIDSKVLNEMQRKALEEFSKVYSQSSVGKQGKIEIVRIR